MWGTRHSGVGPCRSIFQSGSLSRLLRTRPRRQVNCHLMIRRFCRGAVIRGMIFNAHDLRVDYDPQIAIVCVVIAFKCQSVVYGIWSPERASVCASTYFSDGMAAITADKIGNLHIVYSPRIALVIVRVSGKHCMGPEACR